MKKIILILMLGQLSLLITQSCVILVKKDNGKHKGWYKTTHPSHKTPVHPSNTAPGKHKK
jgi:hypothetical protein